MKTILQIWNNTLRNSMTNKQVTVHLWYMNLKKFTITGKKEWEYVPISPMDISKSDVSNSFCVANYLYTELAEISSSFYQSSIKIFVFTLKILCNAYGYIRLVIYININY